MKYIKRFNEGNSMKWYDYVVDDIKTSLKELPIESLQKLRNDIQILIVNYHQTANDEIKRKKSIIDAKNVINNDFDKIKHKFENSPLAELNLSAGAWNALHQDYSKYHPEQKDFPKYMLRISTIGDLLNNTEEDLRKRRNLGIDRLKEVNDKLYNLTGLRLKKQE